MRNRKCAPVVLVVDVAVDFVLVVAVAVNVPVTVFVVAVVVSVCVTVVNVVETVTVVGVVEDTVSVVVVVPLVVELELLVVEDVDDLVEVVVTSVHVMSRSVQPVPQYISHLAYTGGRTAFSVLWRARS
mmetsp:Transcript_116778/g.232768  ORF Transcript_116778/g.232768 Transcript_116778/m.232768 type:complete len:129 (+) Transcript_116778:927-1313(+)